MGKLLAVAKNYPTLLSFIVYAIGLVWLGSLSQPELSYPTYMSENALIAGGVQETFHDGKSLHDFIEKSKEMINQSTTSDVHDWLSTQMTSLGLECFKQDFTFKHGLLSTELPSGEDDFNVLQTDQLQGTNFYAILRSTSGNNIQTEALVLTVPLLVGNCRDEPGQESGDTFCPSDSVGLVMTLAKLFRTQIYWAKDIIILFPEFDYIGLTAWLNAYHGSPPNKYLSWSELTGRSGSLQVGLNFELFNLKDSRMTLHAEGVDGLLTNLDLVNTCVRLAGVNGLDLKVNGRLSDSPVDDREANLIGLLNAVWSQATGSPSGLHGLLIKYQIPAVTLRSHPITRSSRKLPVADSTNVGRYIEAIMRSLNNLQERLHQSFWFYLLPHPSRYVSIGVYIPPALLLIFSLLIEPLLTFLTVMLTDADESASVKSISDHDELTAKLQRSHCKTSPPDQSGRQGSFEMLSPDDGSEVRQRRRSSSSHSHGSRSGDDVGEEVEQANSPNLSDQPQPQQQLIHPIKLQASDLTNLMHLIVSFSTTALCGLVLFASPHLYFLMPNSQHSNLLTALIPIGLFNSSPVMLGSFLFTLLTTALIGLIVNPMGQMLLTQRFSPTRDTQLAFTAKARFLLIFAWAFFLACLSAFNVSTSLLIAVPSIPLLLLYLALGKNPSGTFRLPRLYIWLLASPCCLLAIYCVIHELTVNSFNFHHLSFTRIVDQCVRCFSQAVLEADLFDCHSWHLACLTSSLWMLSASWSHSP